MILCNGDNPDPANLPRRSPPGIWLAAALLFSAVVFGVQAQDGGVVAGKIVNSWDSSPVASVVVSVRGTTLGTQTDAQGNFRLQNVPPGNHTIVFSKSAFQRKSVADVRVATGQVSRADAELKPEYATLDEFEVISEPVLNAAAELVLERKSALDIRDLVGSEFIGRSGAGDAGEVIAKVSGVTIKDGKTAVIRGLSDRYTAATLNGALIPSADPDRQSAQLDLFPSSMIESVSVSKSFTPDQPGGFTGGAINIKTKNIPDRFTFKMSMGVSYNTQVSLKSDFLKSVGGNRDFLGMDDGSRQIPAAIDVPLPSKISSDPQLLPSAQSTVLLTRAYSQSDIDFLEAVNAGLTPQLAPTRGKAPLDAKFSISMGDSNRNDPERVKKGGGVFGYFASLSYDRSYSAYEDAINNDFEFSGGVQPLRLLNEDRGTEKVSWGAVYSMGYEPNEDHTFGFTYLHNQVGEDDSRQLAGFHDSFALASNQEFNTVALRYTERNLSSFQGTSEHLVKDLHHSKFKFLAALSSTSQEDPDFRKSAFVRTTSVLGETYTFPANIEPRAPIRVWREIDEGNRNLKFDLETPFDVTDADMGFVKAGLYHSLSERNYNERALIYTSTGGTSRLGQLLTGAGGDLNGIFDAANDPTINGRRWNYDLFPGARGEQIYDAFKEINAAYMMTDRPLNDWLRLIGGVRFETTEINLNVKGSTVGPSALGAFPGENNQDWLPAAGVVVSLITNMNLRVNYSRTVARPSFQELAPVDFNDFTGSGIVRGNPGLTSSAIENYDIRWEWYLGGADLVSVSYFYKKIKNPIEKEKVTLDGSIISFRNSGQAVVQGVEMEARKGLGFMDSQLKNFSLGGNLSFIRSKVGLSAAEIANKQLALPGSETGRPLFDQSPFVLNLDLTYENVDKGTTVAMFYNLAGERVLITNPFGPDSYERPAPSLDFSWNQRITERWTMKLSARNLLDPENDVVIGSSADRENFGITDTVTSYRRGRSFGVSLSYEF